MMEKLYRRNLLKVCRRRVSRLLHFHGGGAVRSGAGSGGFKDRRIQRC